MSNDTYEVNERKINKEKFMFDIFYGAFSGKRKRCASGLAVSEGCLNAFISEGKVKSHVLPTAIYKYCIANNIQPELYLSLTEKSKIL